MYCHTLITPLSYLINLYLESSILPNILKMYRIIPLFKTFMIHYLLIAVQFNLQINSHKM